MTPGKLEKAAVAILRASLDVECPFCENDFDLFDDDHDFVFMAPIFNNQWDDLNGAECECPHCGKEFKISAVEW